MIITDIPSSYYRGYFKFQDSHFLNLGRIKVEHVLMALCINILLIVFLFIETMLFCIVYSCKNCTRVTQYVLILE